MNKYLKNVLNYFAHFSYAPSFEEIYTFFPTKITRRALRLLIKSECDAGTLVQLRHKNDFSLFHGSPSHYSLATSHSKYTLPQYSIPTSPRLRGAGRRQTAVNSHRSNYIDRRSQTYISLLKWLPLVRFVGITGKSAVEGVRAYDDVDLFVITKHGSIWTTRFLVVTLAKLLGIHGGNGVCLNLFFDESDLIIPRIKQNEYIAHELLQMKPLIDKKSTYSRLLAANIWVFKIFQNARHVIPMKIGIQSNVIFSGSRVEHGMTHNFEKNLESIQLQIIKRNKTGFLITPTQLWLFKRDFERKLKRKGVRKVI